MYARDGYVVDWIDGNEVELVVIIIFLSPANRLFDWNYHQYVSFDLSLARGLTYYTGLIYECVVVDGGVRVRFKVVRVGCSFASRKRKIKHDWASDVEKHDS